VRLAFEKGQLREEHALLDLHQLVEKAYDLEAIPMSGARLAKIVANPDSTINDIIEVVSLDQALTGRVLRASNSAASAARMPVTTVKDAVVRLGRLTTLTLSFGSHVRKQLQASIPEFGLAENMLWQHSVAAALVTESLSSVARIDLPSESYAAALLHDIGKLVLARFLDPDLLEFLRRAQEEGCCNPLQAEMEILEVNHAELGALVVRHWGLPEDIALGVQYHHAPTDDLPKVCHVVCVANELAKLVQPAAEKKPPHPENHEASFLALGVDLPMRRKVVEAVSTRLAKVLEMFGV
jgi:putative nucleotidyltransferase with HDIG domain